MPESQRLFSSMWTKIEYKDIFSYGCSIDYTGAAVARQYGLAVSKFRGKDAYINDNSSGFLDDMYMGCYKPTPGIGKKLYVSKNSKMPRALLRGSDYKIVLDKDNADYIIIPHPGDFLSMQYNLLAVDDDKNLYKISITKNYGCPSITDSIIQNVKEAVMLDVRRSDLKFHYKSDLSNRTVFFVKKCEEYIDILNNNFTTRRCYDISCPFTPTTEINPENLEFLLRCEDNAVFEKMVFGSNWQKYPYTICALLYLKPNYYGSHGLRLVEDAIHYDEWENSRRGYHSNREVTAEDWNMYQRWMMFHLGLDEEKGGMIKQSRYNGDLGSDIKNGLHSIVLVKPLFISEDMPNKLILEQL